MAGANLSLLSHISRQHIFDNLLDLLVSQLIAEIHLVPIQCQCVKEHSRTVDLYQFFSAQIGLVLDILRFKDDVEFFFARFLLYKIHEVRAISSAGNERNCAGLAGNLTANDDATAISRRSVSQSHLQQSYL